MRVALQSLIIMFLLILHAKGDGGTMIVRRSLRGMNRPQRIGGIRPRGGERPKIGGTGVELRVV